MDGGSGYSPAVSLCTRSSAARAAAVAVQCKGDCGCGVVHRRQQCTGSSSAQAAHGLRHGSAWAGSAASARAAACKAAVARQRLRAGAAREECMGRRVTVAHRHLCARHARRVGQRGLECTRGSCASDTHG
ncbi:unnamed protein product [Closterium sp. NIES-64]|nr:unnamed protein product [Closterium sp. NIES-64]